MSSLSTSSFSALSICTSLVCLLDNLSLFAFRRLNVMGGGGVTYCMVDSCVIKIFHIFHVFVPRCTLTVESLSYPFLDYRSHHDVLLGKYFMVLLQLFICSNSMSRKVLSPRREIFIIHPLFFASLSGGGM